ncbi:MAG: hypothetical protein NC432_07695 [Roseburia sp.]|nr:hypothetical protein [Roseburia sp.]MCM1099040.1 hypothetical protein [Ruminococcus flavefaciens]
MPHFSILDLEPPETEDVSRPDFFADLNLNQIIDAVQQESPQYNIAKLYYRFPVGADCAEYRREVYRDLKRPEIYECFLAFSRKMREAAAAADSREGAKAGIQRRAWHVCAAQRYCDAVNSLREALAEKNCGSEGLQRLREYLEISAGREEFQKCREESGAIGRMLADFHLILEIEGNRIVITRGKPEGAYEKRLGYEAGAGMSAPFSGTLGLSPLEEAVLEACRRREPEIFDRMEDFAERFPSYEDPGILQLEQEVQFYLAFYRLEEKMRKKGFDFCVPDRAPAGEMEGTGLYDLALACVNCARGKPVVSNDFAYRPGESFFVVGGPNQGGKTTFARSMGQLVYLAEMGLDVPAARARVPSFQSLLTHFSAEESLGSGKGKLKEELLRLAPMMKEQAEGAFVIINELFTTAAHYDGCVMGKRVLNHFIGKGCMGVYVTHLRELGDSVEGVAPLSALLDGSPERKRTYKIGRGRVEEVGYAEDIVKKYGLTYRELHERLAGAGKEENEGKAFIS